MTARTKIRMPNTLRVVLLAMLGMVSNNHIAAAQTVDSYFPAIGAAVGGGPTDRSQNAALNEYSAGGVRAGSFIIRPDLSESFGYNSNVEGFSGSPGSTFLDTVGSVSASSDWSRNSAYASASVDNRSYLSLPGQNYTNWTAAAGGTIDVGRDVIGASYAHLNLNETPGSLDSVSVSQPVAFRVDFGAPQLHRHVVWAVQPRTRGFGHQFQLRQLHKRRRRRQPGLSKSPGPPGWSYRPLRVCAWPPGPAGPAWHQSDLPGYHQWVPETRIRTAARF